jgi:hypothetical protein
MSAELHRPPRITPEQVYSYLLTFWRLHLTVEDPDLRQLRELHGALCRQEGRLCEDVPDFCLQNLLQRLQETRSLGLQLSMPAWATSAIENLTEAAEEEGLLGEVQS